MYKRIGLSGLAVLSLLAGAAAQADTQPGFYAGVGIGEGTIEADDFDVEESDTAFKIFGGYSFNENFAVELTYLDGGAPGESVSVPGLGTLSAEIELTGINASVIGRLPLANTFAIFGKIGFTSYDAETTVRLGSQSETVDESSEELTYGIGGSFSFGPSFEMRAEYEMADFEGGDYNLLSVSGLFRF